jgi:hypothetical protein
VPAAVPPRMLSNQFMDAPWQGIRSTTGHAPNRDQTWTGGQNARKCASQYAEVRHS